MELVLLAGLASYGFVFAYKTHPWFQPIRNFVRKFSEKLAECTFCISFWVSLIYFLLNGFKVDNSILLSLGAATVSKIVACLINYLHKEQ
ncbi:MAG: hypothetical protein NZZ41_07395 [Candidatus Dojkabacteria bacterium]|nr:hypothetical protein [Candidatus Dojkabacteria bacterium]